MTVDLTTLRQRFEERVAQIPVTVGPWGAIEYKQVDLLPDPDVLAALDELEAARKDVERLTVLVAWLAKEITGDDAIFALDIPETDWPQWLQLRDLMKIHARAGARIVTARKSSYA